MKDKMILFSWITGLLLLISVLWITTTGLQAKYLLRTVNNVFIDNDDSRRLSEYLYIKTGKAELLGYWYSLYNSDNLFFVFTVFQDGILIPLGANVNRDGIVTEIIPLSAHSKYVFDSLPKSLLDIYKNRIENAIQNRRKE